MVGAFAYSPAYGMRVALGPVQADMLRIVHELTAHGRRPELTIRHLAQLAGRPVSSVHAALGRLRALGLVGVAARPGRHGGHRLWRTDRRSTRALDVPRHRRAVARVLHLWRVLMSDAGPETPAVPATDPVGPDARGSGPTGAHPTPPDPFGVTPSRWAPRAPRNPTPPYDGEPLLDKLRRYGLSPELVTELGKKRVKR